jgi:hypothetical protein
MRLVSLGLLLAFGSGCGRTALPAASLSSPTASSKECSSEGPVTPALATSGCNTTAITGGAAPDSACVDRADALALASRWFEALRRSDVPSLSAIMTVPAVIQGFVLDAGSRADSCGARPETNVIGVGIERQVRTSAELNDALSCLALDNLLVGSIPSPGDSTWRQDRRNFRDGNVGSLELTVPDGLTGPLRSFLPKLAAVAPTHLLAQAVVTDNNGVTNHVALAMTVHRPASVDAVYIHEEFRE